jgi:hypothetical protein
MRWRTFPAFAAIDFLSCLLVVFVAVALASKPPEVETFGSYAVVATWPAGDGDVDLYVRDPAGNLCYFHQAQAGQMHLEHDDLGTLETGYGVRRPNRERTVLRGTSAGEYVVGMRLFQQGVDARRLPVAVELWNLKGGDRILKSRTVFITHTGDERTPFRFTLDAQGNLSGFSYLPAEFTASSTAYAGTP